MEYSYIDVYVSYFIAMNFILEYIIVLDVVLVTPPTTFFQFDKLVFHGRNREIETPLYFRYQNAAR